MCEIPPKCEKSRDSLEIAPGFQGQGNCIHAGMNHNRIPGSVQAEELGEILSKGGRIAAYGLRQAPGTLGYEVAKFLSVEGFEILPIGSPEKKIFHQKTHSSLREVRGKVDMVALFPGTTDPERAVEDAIRAGVPVIWFQKGVRAKEAAERAIAAGMRVAYHKCLRAEYLSRWPPVASLYADVGAAD